MADNPAEIIGQKLDKLNADADKMIQQIINVNAYVTKLEQDNKAMLQVLNLLLINQAIACNYADKVAKVIEQVETPK